jgi:uncharacterized membrane protein YgcG
MKKFLRVALVVVVLASLASIAMAEAPTSPAPQPQVYDAFRVAIAAVLSLLSL